MAELVSPLEKPGGAATGRIGVEVLGPILSELLVVAVGFSGSVEGLTTFTGLLTGLLGLTILLGLLWLVVEVVVAWGLLLLLAAAGLDNVSFLLLHTVSISFLVKLEATTAPVEGLFAAFSFWLRVDP